MNILRIIVLLIFAFPFFDSVSTTAQQSAKADPSFIPIQTVMKDLYTGTQTTIPLYKDQYEGIEDLEEVLRSRIQHAWVDPIIEYDFKDINGDGINKIITYQRVIGISHPDTIANLRLTFVCHRNKRKFLMDSATLEDVKGRAIQKVNLAPKSHF